eukprot:518664-Lingulodinium_polyedra.AAC.1
MLASRRAEARPTDQVPGGGPFHPDFDIDRYEREFTRDFRRVGVRVVRSDGSERVPAGQEWGARELTDGQLGQLEEDREFLRFREAKRASHQRRVSGVTQAE